MARTEKEPARPRDLVVVGSSAGGIEALSALVSTLPADFPASVVLAQHLDPNRPSSLDTILRQHTKLPVVRMEESARLEPGTIYVVPANRHVLVEDGHVALQTGETRAGRYRPSVDLLLSTAAAVYGEHLIAVILTGAGADGAAGALDVKAAGGTVIVQNPHTSRYPSMPSALPPTVVDFQMNIEEIGPLLYDLVRNANLPQSGDKAEAALGRILAQVSRQTNIDFRPYKRATILRRIARRMALLHIATLPDYAEFVTSQPVEATELVKTLLINVTEFFRDPEAFACLKTDVLPALIEAARARGRTLRLWSAGCATGEEPFSLAMLVADLLGPELSEWSVKIFATDLDEAAITFARRGVYADTVLRSVPVEYVDRFFDRVDGNFRVVKALRQMVIFGPQDLSRSAPFPRVDLILCRNLLIYFTAALQDAILGRFAFSLHAAQGFLMLGKAETVRPVHFYYELINKQWKLYRCTGEVLPLATPDARLAAAAPSRQVTGPRPARDGNPDPMADAVPLRRFTDLLLRHLPLGMAVIDRSYRLVTTNAAGRRLLGLRDPGADQDFLHAVALRGIPYSDVRAAIDTVFRDRSTVTLAEVQIDGGAGTNSRYLSIAILPMQVEGEGPDLAAVSVTDISDQVQIRRRLETVQSEQVQLVSELSTANRRLNEMNKELLDSNEELQVANEELVLTQEELQATIEEFEATNEELQATNEELETNNEELQATNEELEATNEELRARTAELQEVGRLHELERVRLAEMIELAPFYIMVLRGPDLLVDAFNPRYAPLLAGEKVLGRPLAEVIAHFWDGNRVVLTLAREVLAGDVMRTTPQLMVPVLDAQGNVEQRFFVYTLVPAHDARGRVEGVLIYSGDVTEARVQELERVDRLKDEFLALASHELRTPLTAITGYLGMIRRLLAEEPAAGVQPAAHATRARRAIDTMDTQLKRLKVLIDDLRDVGRLENGKFTLSLGEVDVGALVQNAVEQARMLSNTPPIAVEVPAADAPLVVWGDEGRLLQVLLNLLQNAVTYAPASEQIEVRVARLPAAAPAAPEQVEIAVQDYGPGIAPAAQAELFTRFYRVARAAAGHQEGLGLGLYISRQIIEQHGGTISVRSAPGAGSTFLVCLPLTTPTAPPLG